MFEAGAPPEDSGGERSGADGGARLQPQLGGGPRQSVDQSGDAEARDMVRLEKAVDEGVEEGVIVGMEDANGEEPGGVEDDVDNVGGVEAGPHHVAPVAVIEGIGRLTKQWREEGSRYGFLWQTQVWGRRGPPRARMAGKACCSREAS